ncbi:MAG: LptF/LptG family permease [Candidatus Omnitrophica bacterium]|nr:LptF/LptG family permease [Candidatus Omnitrophota bacterium]
MKIVDRYLIRQLVPVWIWCMVVFVLLSCLIDLFQHLDEIVRYQIPVGVVLHYYVSFMPMVFVQASPLAGLMASAFVASRLVRFQELLAMNAGGISPWQASIPFLFVGWLVGLLVFATSDLVLPRTNIVYEQLRLEAFHADSDEERIESVATIDEDNRLYHGRFLYLMAHRVDELTVLEHGQDNQPRRTIYARQAIYTGGAWRLVDGTITEVGPNGELVGEPRPFIQQLFLFPITPDSFRRPATQPESLSIGVLRKVMGQFRRMGIGNVRRYQVEMVSRLTLPATNMIICLIGFIGSIRRQTRGQLRGLGTSLLWGVGYYLLVAAGIGVGRKGLLPVTIAICAPHALALAGCCSVLADPSSRLRKKFYRASAA